MANDILSVDGDEMPVGPDQPQHLEVAVDLAPPGQPKEPGNDTLVTLPGAFADRPNVAAVEERYRMVAMGL